MTEFQPTVLCTKKWIEHAQSHYFIFQCPWCNEEHWHSPENGHRISHCRHKNAPSGYYLKEIKA